MVEIEREHCITVLPLREVVPLLTMITVEVAEVENDQAGIKMAMMGVGMHLQVATQCLVEEKQ